MSRVVAGNTRKVPAADLDIRFVISGAASVEGGVSAVNLNMLDVLGDLARERGKRLGVLSYRESEGDRPDCLPVWARFEGFGYGKFRLARAMLRGFSRDSLYLFDYLRLARPLLPLLLTGRARAVIFAHGWDYWKRLRPIDARILRHATLCLTNSSFTLKKMREKLPDFEGQVCQLGLSPRFPLNRHLPPDRGPALQLEAADGESRQLEDRMLLLTGRMEPGERNKGHYPMLKLLPRLVRLDPRIQLVFPGPGGDRNQLRRLAIELGVGNRVFLPGHVPVEMLLKLYRRCYAFVMPSTQEGFGLVYLEAMNFGRPCVGCWNQGAEDVIVDGETGFLLHDPWDFGEMEAVLGRLIGDADLASRLGESGFDRLHQNFTARHFQERFRRHLDSIL